MTKSGVPRSPPFGRVGRLVYRRRKYVVIAWILALVLLSPVIAMAGNSTSLEQGTASGSQLESVQASNLIAAQFAKSVANSTLLVVVDGANVSSPATQVFVQDLVRHLGSDPNLKGLNQTIDVYSPIYSAIKGVNQATYSTLKGANSTSRLLLGVPALYFGAWQQAYASSHNLTAADYSALSFASGVLSAANATAYRDFSSHLLALFNTAWSSSWSDSSLSNLTLLARASMAARTAGTEYAASYMRGSEQFADSLLRSVSFADYITGSSAETASKLAAFAQSYVSNSTGFSSQFVGSSFGLGKSYDNSSLFALAGSIIWKPGEYGVGRALSTLISSLVSPSRDITLVTLNFDQSSNSNVLALRSEVSSVLGTAGAGSVGSALVTGGDAISYDFGQSAQSDLSLILPVTITLLIVATGLFFRSVLTPFVTLGTIGVALGISQVFIVLVSALVAKADFTVPTILLTILIGVGTDYSVFILARYREERVKGADVQRAVETSVTWAGESITTSGATVIISFLSLTFTNVVYLKTIGYVVGLGVLVALLIALTMVPAVASIIGGRTFWPYSGERFTKYSRSVLTKLESKRGYFSRSGAFSVKHAGALIVLALVATAPALYVYSNTSPTFDFLSAAPASLPSVAASDQLTSAFGGGTLFPTYVVMTFSQPLVAHDAFNLPEMRTVSAVSSYLASLRDVRNVSSPTVLYGQAVAYDKINLSTAEGRQTFSGVLQSIGRDNKTVLFTINFGIDPYSTAAISDAQAIRQTLHSQYGPAPGVTGIYVGGASGSTLDTKNEFDSQFNTIVPIVAVGVAIVLLAVLGSLFLPVFAVLSILMSVVWTVATTALVFKQLYDYQILFITPFFLFVTLLGLGMDYNIFILTRIREEATKGKPLNEAIVGAIEQTGAVITAAAIILAGSLGALMISSDLLLKEIGFSLAYAILIDALVVRTYLVPAVMSKVGKWNWFSPIPFLNRSHHLYEKDAGPPSTP
ncbi:MAG: MMPL family transporter [Nitrososphaerota archaeon]|nr:MMPL family transporter [Nitrososphaerota archaeon]